MEMYAYKCTECGRLHHPKHFVCKNCGSVDFEEIPLNDDATVVTWTKVYNLPEGYMKPYLCFAIVRFDNSGLIVTGRIDADYPEIGMRVRPTVEVVKENVGYDDYGFIFKPL